MSIAAEYIFEWDPDKAGRNQKKHVIGFEQATTVFKDPRAISVYDATHSKQEDRWVTLGLSADHGLLVVCHTFKWVDPSVARIRIFSCRKATRYEIRQYAE
ncbi:MAG: BrnT family toxin [Phycisphaerae bacterium]|nr:BrnT family toxin [Phycisphaerae bacterium]